MVKTAESVSPRHPDKLCDQISDAILDACLEQDPDSRVAIEVMGGHGIITITGELTTNADFNVRDIAQRIAGEQYGVQINIVKQSPEIANGVDTGGAGDQGIMVGYACNDNEAMIPQEQYLARELCKFIYNEFPYDGKTQITLDEEGFMRTVVASFQNVHTPTLKAKVERWLSKYASVYAEEGKVVIHANPAGDWSQGGFESDTGLTGRKLIVDNYGPQIPIGGGCFSGKDATKVDRSGAYMARKIAVDMLKANPDSKEVLVKIAYAIGVADPVMVTAQIDGEIIEVKNAVVQPLDIIAFLGLRTPQFEETAKWGHMGNNFKWDN